MTTIKSSKSSPKQRLDALLVARYPEYSRAQLASWIMQGYVLVNGHPITKAGTPVREDAEITLTASQPKYVCRAGYKLEHALDTFGVSPEGLVVLDAGLSTGGFTDCLLQRGARSVYGVDVGYGQVHERIRMDNRVCVMERTNLRHLTQLPELVDLVTLDLSFISLLKVIDAVAGLMKDTGQLITLIKPQFEAGKEAVGKGGIVSDPAVHEEVIARVTKGIEAAGFIRTGVTPSPIKGATGNTEFLAHFVRTAACTKRPDVL